MKTSKQKLFGYFTCLVLFLAVVAICPIHAHAASTLKINLTNNQTFYILPGSDTVKYQVKITAGAGLGDQATFTSDNILVAPIDSYGKLILKDAGSAKITVNANGMSVSRTIKIINRTDWTKAAPVKNYEKLTVKNQTGTFQITNQMDFPLRVTYTYNTYNSSNATLQIDQKTASIHLPANTTATYKQYFADNVKYVSVTGATFQYDQFGWKRINAKKVTISQKTSTSKNIKTIKATVTNKNKNSVIVPYQTYVCDKNGKLSSIDYAYMTLNGNQKKSIKNSYFYKKTTLDEYVSKVTYKFLPALPAVGQFSIATNCHRGR